MAPRGLSPRFTVVELNRVKVVVSEGNSPLTDRERWRIEVATLGHRLLFVFVFIGGSLLGLFEIDGFPLALAAGWLLLCQGAYVTRRPVAPADVAYTIYEAVGVDPHRWLMHPEGRPIEILDRGEFVRELFV